MNERTPSSWLLLIIGLLLLPLGCGGSDGEPLGVDEPTDPRLILQPNELCSDHSSSGNTP